MQSYYTYGHCESTGISLVVQYESVRWANIIVTRRFCFFAVGASPRVSLPSPHVFPPSIQVWIGCTLVME
jgi:hypothetical protein